MNSKILMAIYLFCSVVALGMGMGLPVLNFVLGVMAGVYIARKMHFIKADEENRKKAFRRTAVFTAAAMVMVCCLITLLAIAGEMPHAQVKTPYLSFTFTVPIFFAVVLSGGAVLVLLQYLLTRISAQITIKLWP